MNDNKQILTTEGALYDIRTYYTKMLKSGIISTLLLGFFIFSLTLFASFHSIKMALILQLLFSPLHLIFWCVAITLPKYYKKRKRIVEGNFKIVSDKLIDRKRKVFRVKISDPHVLYFERYGIFSLLDQRYYSWSQRLSMNDDDLFMNSHIGDNFYLLIDENSSILYAYNSKLFDFKE